MESGNASLASSVGAVLLDLRNALQQAERCRLALRALGYSQARWQEIVRDVDPELRFALRPQVLDAQGAGIPQRIKQSITQHLRSGYLMLYTGNKVGLPEWKDRKQRQPDQMQQDNGPED